MLTFWIAMCSSWTLAKVHNWRSHPIPDKSIDIFLISSVVYHSKSDQNRMFPDNDERYVYKENHSVDIVLTYHQILITNIDGAVWK